jgi:uncharacterized protein YjbJ (UPF0337 family)
MNSDNVDRQWEYLRGEVKAWWDQLTDADLEQVAGKKAQLVALVQDRYGYTGAGAAGGRVRMVTSTTWRHSPRNSR